MNCWHCQAENPTENQFCGKCGKVMEAKPEAVAVEGQPGVYYCARHKKETTRVRCGKCETPICTRCMVHGPAGVRCRDCARNRVPIRARGVLHEVGRTMENGAQGAGRVVWYMVLINFVVSLFSGLFGGHRDL